MTPPVETPVRPPARRSGGAVSARHGEVRLGHRPARGWFVADEPGFRSRSAWLMLAFVAMSITLAGRLWDVQVRQGSHLSAMAAAAHQMSIRLQGHRGQILDASGNVLASDTAVYDVWADPKIVGARAAADAAALAPILGMGQGALQALLSEPGLEFVYLKKGVAQDAKDRIDALGLDGVLADERDQRTYEPSPVTGVSFAEPLLGYVDNGGTGRYGVEQYYNAQLQGTDGSTSTVRDVNGNAIVLSNRRSTPAHNGGTLTLGLDSRIQYWAEQAIAQGVNDAQAESGQVLIMDTRTGAIRAWAQYPTYNANDYGHADVSAFRDQSIADLYEPGSTMKVITFAGGLNTGAITPGTTLNEGPVTIDGYTIHDWDHRGHGNITMQQVLDQSLNDGAIKVMELMGHDAFYANLLSFGIGSPTGIDLAGEQAQHLPPQTQWSDINYATAAFGQGVDVTPVEVLAGINAVANGGVWIQPHVVTSITDPTSGKVTPVPVSTRRVMTPGAASTLATMMTGVVDHSDGEGFLARIPGFKGEVAGKTGTADEPTNGQYAGDLVVSFAGFLPASNPQFTMLVVLRHPHETHVQRFGAFLAAPVFKSIAQVAIDQWRILP